MTEGIALALSALTYKLRMQSKRFMRGAMAAVLALTVSISPWAPSEPARASLSYNFTTAGASGTSGPSQTQIDSAYANTNLAGLVTRVRSGEQRWTVPTTGTYEIYMGGARGGSVPNKSGGQGGWLRTELSLTAGHQIRILVGQMGGSLTFTTGYAGGGGGGSWLYNETTNTLLAVAGGGGGSAQGSASYGNTTLQGGRGTTTSSGSDGIGYSGSHMSPGAGGTSGTGGSSGGGSGGGGYTSSGADGYYGGTPGQSYASHDGLGGVSRSRSGTWIKPGDGGFGGGAGAGMHSSYEAIGGGGGGYSGGGGGGARVGAGGGGGMYNTGTLISTETHNEDGFVTFTLPAPVVNSFTTAQASPSNSNVHTYNLSFSSSVSGLASGDFSNAGTATNCSFEPNLPSGVNFTITITGCSEQGTLIPTLSMNAVTDSASTPGPTASYPGTTLTLDRIAPTLTFSQPSTPTKDNPVTLSVTSTKTLNNLTTADFSAPGCTPSLSGSGSTYTLSLANCTEGPITLSMTGDATDAAGNSAIKPADVTFTADRTFLVGTKTSPSTPSNQEPLTFSYTPGETLAAGASLLASEISVTGNGCSLDPASIAANGATFEFDVLGCEHQATAQVAILAGALADPAGNTNPQIDFNSVVIDKEVGVQVIGEPANQQYNSGAIDFTLNFSESVSGLNDDEISITGAASGCQITPFDEQNNFDTFVVSVTGCQHGASVMLTLGVNSVFDALNNYGPTTPVQTSAFTIDLLAPELQSVVPRDTIQNSSTVIYDVTFSEPVNNVAASMFTTTSAGCSAPALSSAGGAFESAWVVTLTGCDDGTVELDVAITNVIEDPATNQLDDSEASATMSVASVIVDTVAPTSSWQAAPAGPLNTQASYTIDFSEPIDATSFVGTDITNSGTATGCVFVVSQIDSDSFTVTSTGCSDGSLQPVIAAGSILDPAGNSLDPAMSSAARTAGIVMLDFTSPSVSFSLEPTNPTNALVLNYQVTFNEPVQTPDPADFAMVGGVSGCAIAITPDATNQTTVFDLAVSSCSEGLAILVVNQGGVADVAGNLGPTLAATASAVNIDRTAAVATVSNQTPSPTKDTTLVFGISFDEPISGFAADVSHFTLTGDGCTLGTLTGTQPGTIFTLSVTGCAVATTAALSVVADSVTDAAGNTSPAAVPAAASIVTDRVPASVTDFSVFSGNDNGSVTFNLEFDEPVTGLSAADFSAGGVMAATPVAVTQLSSSQYRIDVQALSSGNLTLSLGSQSVLDGPGNLSPAVSVNSEAEAISFDSLTGAFVGTRNLTSAGKTNNDSPVWRIAVSRAIDLTDSAAVLDSSEVTLLQGSCTGLSVSAVNASTFDISTTGCTDGVIELEIAQDSIVDPDGNSWPAVALAADAFEIDTVAPTAVATSPTGAEQLVRQFFQFVFSETVTGLTLDDFSVASNATATGCQLSYQEFVGRVLVQTTGCSDGTVGVTLAANSVIDEAANPGPSSPITTSLITKTTVAPVVTQTPATDPEPVLLATAPDRFVGPLTQQAQQALVDAGVVRAPEGTAMNEVTADFTQLQNPTADAEIAQAVSIQTGETLMASMSVDASMAATHEAVGYLRVNGSWIDLGSTLVEPDGVVTVPATFTEPGNYFMRIIVRQPVMQSMGLSSLSFGVQSITADPIMLMQGQVLELDITVTGTALELTIPQTSVPTYSGPILDNAPQTVTSLGGEVSYRGSNLASVKDLIVDGISMEITNLTDGSLTVQIKPLAPGNYSIQLQSDTGTVTVQDALIVTIEIQEYVGPGTFVTKRISDTEIKIYAKDMVSLGKVQFFVNGREIAWVRALDESDPKLRVVVGDGDELYYLVRTVVLDKRLRIEIKVDGQRAKFATYNPDA